MRFNRAVQRKAVAVLALGFGVFPGAVTPLQAQTAGETVSLGRAITVALANSRTIADANQGLRVAGAQVREAWSSVLPDISASASYQRNFRIQEAFLPAQFLDPNAGPNDLIAVRFGADNSWQAGLSLSQPLFEVGAFIGLGVAGRFRSLEEERLRGVVQGVVSSVRLAYFNTLLRLEEVRLNRESIERVRQTLGETKAMKRAGLASAYDVLRLEVQLANLEPNLRRAEDGVATAERSLAVAMGTDPTTPVRVEGELHAMDIADPAQNSPENATLLALSGPSVTRAQSFDDLHDQAFVERSDLRQARLGIELQRARVAVERAEYFPKLSIFSNYNIVAQENGSPSFFGENTNQRSTSFAGGIRIELPIFTGFKRDARMAQAKAAVRQNQARLELTEQQTVNELQTALASLEEARVRVESQRRAVDQAQRGFEIASAEYRAGLGSQLQITDAEVALRQSEFNYAQAVYDYLTARSNLDAATGSVPDDPALVAAYRPNREG